MSDRTEAAAGQITASAAEVYEREFVPALFGSFAGPLISAAGVKPGSRVLDVATGTGVVARAAAAQGADVTAVDINPGMIEVARRVAPDVGFQVAPAENLPFTDDSFDSVVCQFGLMFFADHTAAISEMARVCRRGGRVAVAVFAGWRESPGYRDLIPLIAEVVGPDAAEALKAPFCLGDPDELVGIFARAGLSAVAVERYSGALRHASLDTWLDTEIAGWTLASMVDASTMGRLKTRARDRLAGCVTDDGSVTLDAPAMFAIATT